jgi:REP element-mobilizing transposase RayT
MVYDPEKHKRRSVRLKGYDYSKPGFYYVTICTQDRIERFGHVENEEMILNDAGKMVDAEWNRVPERYEHVVLDEYKIMPNHMHGILQIKFPENGGRKTNDPGIVGTGLVPVLTDGEKTS